jgi:hypothetical protein
MMSMLDGVEILDAGELVHQVVPYTRIDSLISQYHTEREAIIKMAGYFAKKAPTINYFLTAAKRASSKGSYSAEFLFRAEPALRALDAHYWQRALDMTDVMEYMPAGRREEWNKNIREHSTYAFDEPTVKDTIAMLLSLRAAFFGEMVDGIFRGLSKGHLTNQPEGFSKRMIMQGTCVYGTLKSSAMDIIHDLRCVIAKFVGRDQPTHVTTNVVLYDIFKNKSAGDWYSMDGGAFKLKMYQVGTFHIEVHPQIAYRLNQVLAGLYPQAIPNKYRTRRKPSAREEPLQTSLISFAILEELQKGQWDTAGTVLSFYFASAPLSNAASNVLERIGGFRSSESGWRFITPCQERLNELFRNGAL